MLTLEQLSYFFFNLISKSSVVHYKCNTVEPSGKDMNVSLKLQNLVHFQALFLTNPLMTDHLFWKAIILGDLYRGVPLYFCLKLVQCNGYIVSTVDTDGPVLLH